MGDLDSFKNDDSFELAIPCEFDHTNSTLTAPQQVGRSTNSLFVEDLKRNPEEITNIVMDDSFINYWTFPILWSIIKRTVIRKNKILISLEDITQYSMFLAG